MGGVGLKKWEGVLKLRLRERGKLPQLSVPAVCKLLSCCPLLASLQSLQFCEGDSTDKLGPSLPLKSFAPLLIHALFTPSSHISMHASHLIPFCSFCLLLHVVLCVMHLLMFTTELCCSFCCIKLFLRSSRLSFVVHWIQATQRHYCGHFSVYRACSE